MNDPDVIVIGSGYGGLLSAWRLARAGARVLLLERGRQWRHDEFQRTWHPRYLEQLYEIAWSTELTELYRASRVVGGGSVLNDMMSQRTPREAFDWRDADTGRRAWPTGVDRDALNPYYAELEGLLGVRQLGWAEIPKIGANFGRLFDRAGLSCDRGRMNIGACVRCGWCEAGCDMPRGKITLETEVLPMAEATGNFALEANVTAVRLRPRGGRWDVGVTPTQAGVKGGLEWRSAPRVVVAAGPLGTVPLLLRSRLGGLPALGQWMSNNGDVNFVFELPPDFPDHEGYKSTTNAGMISYAFWDDHRATMHPGMFPLVIFGALDVREPGALPWGLRLKHYVRDNAVNRLIPVNAMAQLPAQASMEIDRNGGPRIHNPRTPELVAHVEKMYRLALRVADGAGGRVLLTGHGDEPLDQGGNHLIGGARMSDDGGTGVTDMTGAVWGHPGLYVTDATSIPAGLGINPSLTIGANALRISDHIVAAG